jgi:hypothetical protein
MQNKTYTISWRNNKFWFSSPSLTEDEERELNLSLKDSTDVTRFCLNNVLKYDSNVPSSDWVAVILAYRKMLWNEPMNERERYLRSCKVN